MNAIPYLFLTQLKNRVKEFFKKPASWILAIFFVGMLGLVIFTGGKGETGETRDISELYAIVTALLSVMYMLITFSGLKNGTSLFTLADTHTLFTSPIRPRSILFYGLFRQLGTSLLVGFFILFQYAWMHQLYGVSVGFLIAVLVGYGVAVFAGQLTALTLYTLSSGKPILRARFKTALYAICALAGAYLIYEGYRAQPEYLPALVSAANGAALAFFPVGGWLGASIRLFFTGNPLLALVPLLGFGLFIALIVWLLMKSDTDYYEDVLGATQTAYDAIQARREGRGVDATPKNVKTGKTGLGHASGAGAIAAKLRLESRRARKFLLEPMSLIFLICTIVYAYFVRNLGIIPILFFTTYLQLFEVGNARWTRELQKPYVYLVPEPPFKKLLYLMSGEFGVMLLISVVQYAAIGAILGLGAALTVCLILARFGLGVLIMAGNVLYDRILGGVKAKGLMMVFYMLILLVVLVPPVAVGIWQAGLTTFGLESPCMAILLMALTALVEAALVLFLCRDTLTNAEVV